MRDVEGLLPQEAFDELLKFLFYKDCVEATSERINLRNRRRALEKSAEIREIFSKELALRALWALQLRPGARFRLLESTSPLSLIHI